MTELSVLERVRAAVAEAGYDPTVVIPDPEGVEDWAWMVADVPERILWRARETVGDRAALCHGCWVANPQAPTNLAPGCLAVRRFVEDCGRDRTDP